MRIVIINDNGKTETIRCRKIEPSTLSMGRVIIDEGERVIDLADILVIKD